MIRILRTFALAAVLAVLPVASGCSGSPDNGNTGTVQGEEVGAGSHTEIESGEGASMHHHGSGHYHH